MAFKLVFKSSVSACFELIGDKPYYSDSKYSVTINGAANADLYETNVFSIYGLNPDTEYIIGTSLDDFTFELKTNKETVCLNVQSFMNLNNDRDQTQAIQAAIFACPEGGRVHVPAGTYRIKPLILKSGICLDVDENAILLASEKREDYPVWPGEVPSGEDVFQVSSWEGDPKVSHQSILSAWYQKDIIITGKGILDGNAQNGDWWEHPKQGPGRPRMLFLNNCDNVVLHGITVRNSPAWNLHPFFSRKIGFYDIHVEAPKDSPNTDGCNPESCDGVEVIGARFSVGDDAIAIKSGKLYMGAKYNTPANAHTIRNCMMEFAHGGVVLGSEMSGGVTNLTVSQCLFRGTDRGLRIKTRRGRGKNGVIDGVTFENIRMENVLAPLVMNMFYYCDPDGKSEYAQCKTALPVDDRTPYLGRFTFRNMVCLDCEYTAGFFYGLPEKPIESVCIENVSFKMNPNAGSGFPAMMNDISEHSRQGLIFTNVNRVNIKDVSFENVSGENIQTHNVGKINI